MASLTHVCMWQNNGWKRITATEAARLHPGGTVSAHSGLFMCDLCGQYVLFTSGDSNIRHFRHSSSEKSKDCPERRFGPNVLITYGSEEHDLPIKITNITPDSFSLAIGFVQVPKALLTANTRIEIRRTLDDEQPIVYMKERLYDSGITYLSLGNILSEKYYIKVIGSKESIQQYWPASVQGITPEGTLFDVSNGKKVVSDADVSVGKHYYLLKKGSIIARKGGHLEIHEVSRKRIKYDSWRLYEVVAKDYDEESARFFLDYHCRLTEKPIALQPVWPVFIETPYIIKANSDNVFMHLIGNAPTTQTFPRAQISKYGCSEGVILEIKCNNRQQLISAGRTKSLQYTYFWKERLNQKTEMPSVSVTDINEKVIESEVCNNLPNKRILRVCSPYDGFLIIKSEGLTIERRKIAANLTTEIDEVGWNTEIYIYIGLDCVWKTKFFRPKVDSSKTEIEILSRLQAYREPMVPVPHSLGVMAMKLKNYSNIRKWIYKCIRAGYMSERAYREIYSFVTNNRLSSSK